MAPTGGRGMRQIDHVIVLMLENRSFDSMLGWLHADRPTARVFTSGRRAPCRTAWTLSPDRASTGTCAT